MTKNQVLQNKTPRRTRYKWVRGSINKFKILGKKLCYFIIFNIC
jgi:hypothetical protein